MSTVAASAVSKSFGAVTALTDVSVEFKSGEVVGIVGDNGAGKSTLIKILAGTISPDSGSILIDGREVHLNSPHEARDLGIETVYQDLSLVDQLRAHGNVFLGRELLQSNPVLRWLGVLDQRAMAAKTQGALESLRVKIPGVASKPVHRMSGGQRQAIAIARAAFWGNRFLLLDEPTAALGATQTIEVEGLIRRMREGGVPVALISHNLRQVFDLADHIVVLRLGRKVFESEVGLTTTEEVVAYITGAKGGDSVSQ